MLTAEVLIFAARSEGCTAIAHFSSDAPSEPIRAHHFSWHFWQATMPKPKRLSLGRSELWGS